MGAGQSSPQRVSLLGMTVVRSVRLVLHPSGSRCSFAVIWRDHRRDSHTDRRTLWGEFEVADGQVSDHNIIEALRAAVQELERKAAGG